MSEGYEVQDPCYKFLKYYPAVDPRVISYRCRTRHCSRTITQVRRLLLLLVLLLVLPLVLQLLLVLTILSCS